jgi:hypothetical protein
MQDAGLGGDVEEDVERGLVGLYGDVALHLAPEAEGRLGLPLIEWFLQLTG